MAVQYTDPETVTDVATDATAPRNPYRTGYGKKIPTARRVKYGSRWHRVYVMCWSNAGTAYILVAGQCLVLDTDTEYRFEH